MVVLIINFSRLLSRIPDQGKKYSAATLLVPCFDVLDLRRRGFIITRNYYDCTNSVSQGNINDHVKKGPVYGMAGPCD